MILYQCECSRCKKQFEELIAYKDRNKHIPCHFCEGYAKRVVTPVRFKLDGTDPAYTTAWDKWERIHRKEHARDPSGDYDNLSPLQVESLKAQ